MGYERDRHNKYTRGDYRGEADPTRRRRSRSRSDSERRADRYHSRHHYEREHEFGRKEERHHRHSRSRSRERRSEEEVKAEEREQKIRLAIRNNTINYELGLHELLMKLPEAKREELMEQAQSGEKIHECILVRELYVSGMFETEQNSIRSFFSKYGEIEEVEIIKNFIFVKYFKVEDASNACADYHNINTTLHQTHNANFKIFFADHLKRFNVVSNSQDYEIKEHLIPVLYASLRNDPQYTNEQYLQGIFSRFGHVRNLEVKRNELPTQRTYVLVEYETLAQTFRAREKMRLQREKLGDRKSEITILIDNDKITRLYPNINNQLRYQRKRQQNTAPMAAMPGMPNAQPPQRSGMERGHEGRLEHHQMQMLPHHDSFYGGSQPHKETEDIFAMLKEFAEKEEHEEEHAEYDWCGFMTRNKQFKVEVDFERIHKEPFELDLTVLNVGYRANIEEGLNRGDYVLAGKFRAANQTNQSNQEAFAEYLSYFSKKERAGVIFTNKYLIYLLPPLPHLNIPYALEPNELLALFFKIP